MLDCKHSCQTATSTSIKLRFHVYHIARTVTIDSTCIRIWIFNPWPDFGLRVLLLPASVNPSVCLCVNHELFHTITCHLFQARIIKFGPEVQNTLVKISVVYGVDWPWPLRSNLTWKSKLTSFWACSCDNSPPIQVMISKLGPKMYLRLIEDPY